MHFHAKSRIENPIHMYYILHIYIYNVNRNEKFRISHELQLAKRIYKKANHQYLNNRSNIDRRQNYLIEKRKYKKAIYKAKKIAREYKLNRFADLDKSDSKKFWADLKCILRPREYSCSYIDHGKWL